MECKRLRFQPTGFGHLRDPIVANHYFVIYIGIHINGERTLRKVKLKCRILDIDCIYPVLGQRNIDRLPHARDRDHGRTVIVIRVLGNGKLQDRVAENVVAPDIRDPIPAAVGKRDGQFRNVRMQFDLDIGAQCFDGHILLGKKGQRIARFRNDFQGSDSRSRKELEGRFTAL